MLKASQSDIAHEHFEALSKGLDMSSDQCSSIGHIMVMEVNAEQIPLLYLLHSHTQKLTELSILNFPFLETEDRPKAEASVEAEVIAKPEDSAETYIAKVEVSAKPEDSAETDIAKVEVSVSIFTKFPKFYPLLKTLTVQTNSLKSFIPILRVLPSMSSLARHNIKLCPSMLFVQSDIDVDADVLSECCTQHLEITWTDAEYGNCRMPLFAISSEVKSLSLSCLTLTSDHFTLKKQHSLNTLKLYSCMIPDDACTALVDLLQSLETFELSHLHRLQCSTDNIPKELWKGIGSSCTLKSCVLDGFHGLIVQYLVAGLEKNESLSRLEELTVLCSGFSLGKDDCDHYNELIRVVNKHTAVTNLKLTRDFKEFVRKHNIRDSLTIDTDCTYTYIR